MEVSASKQLTFKMSFGDSEQNQMTMNLQPSMKDGYLFLVSRDCETCTTQQAIDISDLVPQASDALNFTIFENSRLKQLHAYDTNSVLVPQTAKIYSEVQNGQYQSTSVAETLVYAITTVTSKPLLKWNEYNDGAGYDGVLGLGYVDPNYHDYWKTASLTDKLSRDLYIGQPVFSIYVSLNAGNSSFIKFGGWDKGAIVGNQDPIVIKAATNESFGLKFKDFIFADAQI